MTELQTFVREALSRGVAREQIRASLAAARWRPEEIEAELARWAEGPAGLPVPVRRVSVSAREAFVYLVLFATLYVVAFHAGAILFAAIERWLPDAAGGRTWEPWRQAVRWGAASILIAFPVFLHASRTIGRSLARDPEKRSSGVRRWLTYLTLFVAALVLIGDLVVVVSRLLSGELATRFVLKAAVVFAIAGVVFGHYLGGLRGDEDEPQARPGNPWFGRVGAAGVVLTLVVALLQAGSPVRARTRELDQQRLRDVESIARHLRSYYAQKGRLPGTLEEAQTIPDAPPAMAEGDPESHLPYGYQLLDSVTVRLEARFASRDSVGPYGDAPSRFWAHPAGPHGFRFSLRGGRSDVPLDSYRD